MVQAHSIDIQKELNKVQTELLYDPQTSGGLIFSLPEPDADVLVVKLNDCGISQAAKIGRVTKDPEGITVI